MAEQRKRRRLSADGTYTESSALLAEEQPTAESSVAELNPSTQKQQRRQLFVRSLPPTATTEDLTAHFSEAYPIKHATVVVDPQTKQSRGYGFVTFADVGDAQDAAEKFNGSILQGRKIKVEVAESRHRELDGEGATRGKSVPSASAIKAKAERQDQLSQAHQPPRLIVRNLPWTIKEPDQLAALFRSHGKIKHAVLPKKGPGLLAGFGFVVMRGRKNAEKALGSVNGKEVDGRTLAVDWAVEKSLWEGANARPRIAARETETNQDGEHIGDEENFGNELDGPFEEDIHGENLSNRSEADEDEEMDEGIDGSASAEDADQDASEKEDLTPKASVADPTTIFIRNLAFTTGDEALEEHFGQFGPVRYARVVTDAETGRSRGTGFVCFYNQSDATSSLKGAPRTEPDVKKKSESAPHPAKRSILEKEWLDKTGQYTLEGRVLQVARAVSRTDASRLADEGSSKRFARDTDKRRLYLLSEGTIPKDSSLYDQLAPSEAAMREASARQRQALVKNNPSLHLSLTRLSIRNIPRKITSKDLKALAREAVVGFAKDVKSGRRKPISKEELDRGGEAMKSADKLRKQKGKGIVKQAKIVFEGREGGKVAEDSGAGRSRGYGFIEYASHRSALMGLRWLNGHTVGTPGNANFEKPIPDEDRKDRTKRLIVEFALENAQVVQRRQEREEKARERAKSIDEQKKRDELPNGPVKAPKGKGPDRGPVGKKGMKRKMDHNEQRKAGASTEKDTGNDAQEREKLAKRQRIIAKKRQSRKAKKSGRS